jgi:hypothetical protein
LIDTRTHAATHLGGDDELIARTGERCERAAQEPLGLTFRINVGRVDEVHTGVERRSHQRLDLSLTESSDHLPKAFAPEGHGTETELGDE